MRSVRYERLSVLNYTSSPSSIMKVQSSDSVGSYKLKDMQLEYETIESDSLAQEVRSSYEVGRSLAYGYSTRC